MRRFNLSTSGSGWASCARSWYRTIVWTALAAGYAAFPADAYGQTTPVVTNLSVDQITRSSARLNWRTDVPTAAQVLFDTPESFSATNTYRFRTGKRVLYGTSSSWHISGLAPATTYVACPLVSTAAGGQNTCIGATDQVQFTTAPEDPRMAESMEADLPNVSSIEVDQYEAPQNTVVVPVDENKLCVDFQSIVNSAARGTTIVIPAGATCRGAFTFPAKTGDGWIVIRTSTPDDAFVPANTRVTPEWLPAMATIEASTPGTLSYAVDLASGANHYRFYGIAFTHARTANPDETDPVAHANLVASLRGNVSDIVFNQCLFYGKGYPDRVIRAVNIDGRRVAVVNSYFHAINYWRPYKADLTVSRVNATTLKVTSASGKGMIYWGETATSFPASATITLSGSGNGAFRLYATRDGQIVFRHNVASLQASCDGCTESYDPQLPAFAPADAFPMQYINDNPTSGTSVITEGMFANGTGGATGTDPGAGMTSRYNAEGSYAFLVSAGPGPYIFRNNYVDCLGISWFVQEHPAGDEIPSDLEITNNTFIANDALRVAAAGDKMRLYARRQHFELKRGVRVLIEGNELLDGWADVTQSFALVLTPRTGPDTLGRNEIRDVTIRNNYIVNDANGIQIAGSDSNAVVQVKRTRRIVIENNFLDRLDGHQRRSFRQPPTGAGSRGIAIMIVYGVEDMYIRHNTVYDNRGTAPRAVALVDGWSDGIYIRDNIFWYHGDGNNGGLRTSASDMSGWFPLLSGEGAAGLASAVRRFPGEGKWEFTSNLMVTGYKNSQNLTGNVDPSEKAGLYPPSNFFAPGATATDRETAARIVRPGSPAEVSANPYRASATDGQSIGVRLSDLVRSLRILSDVRAEAGSSSVIVSYTTMDGGGCAVDLGVSPTFDAGYLRQRDNGGGSEKYAVFGELTPGTTYYYRVLCPSRRSQGEIATIAEEGAETSLTLQTTPPPGSGVVDAVMEYGPNPDQLSAFEPQACVNDCTFVLPARVHALLYHRVKFRNSEGATVAETATVPLIVK